MPIRRRLGRWVLAVLVSFGIFCATGEIASRALGLVDRLNGYARDLFVATDDARCPYVMRAGTDTLVRRGERTFRVRTNALGMRSPAVEAVPAPGVRRVLVLGDSAAFGEGLAVEEAFPALLERELATRTGGRWEVLNAGVEGYNTEAEVGWLERWGTALRPETVVVGFNLNDFDAVPVIGPLGVLTNDRSQRVDVRSPLAHSELYLLLRWLVATGGRGVPSVPEAPSADAETRARFQALDLAVSHARKRWWAAPDDARWRTMADALARLGEVARARAFRLVVAILPDGDQVGVAAPDLTPQRRLAALCAEQRLDCLDLQPAFAAAGDVPLHLDVMHPNAAGHRLVAGALAENLLREPAGAR